MKYYHGSIVPNLKRLHPFNVNNSLSDKECIYLTGRKEMALLYIWVRKFMWLTYGFDKDANIVYTETHKDALKQFYKDVKGYIYTVELSDYKENDTKIKHVKTVYDAVDILEYEVIEDVYEKILKYEHSGLIKIRWFDDLNDEDIKRNKKMILHELENDLYKNDKALLGFIKMTFPEVYAEFENLK